jgi:hypothetical protein
MDLRAIARPDPAAPPAPGSQILPRRDPAGIRLFANVTRAPIYGTLVTFAT